MPTVRKKTFPPEFSRRDWLTLAGLAVLACVIFVGFKHLTNTAYFDAAHAAYRQGDCATVVREYERMDMDNAYLMAENVHAMRAAELRECRAYMKSVFKWESNGEFNTPREPADALIAFTAMLKEYADSPVIEAVKAQVRDLYTNTPAAEIAESLDYCQALQQDVDTFVLVVNREEVLPELLAECGRMYRTLDLNAEALFCNDSSVSGRRRTNDCAEDEKILNRSVGAGQYFNAFLARFPQHARKDEVEELLLEELNIQAEVFDTAALPQADIIGYNDSDKATLTIQNAAPDILQIAINADFFVLKKCEECRTFTETEIDKGEGECLESAPSATYELEPGVYNIVVSSAPDEPFITPFRGTWKLEAGTEYFSCFFTIEGE